MPAQIKAQRWGDRVTVPIPSAIAKRLRIRSGTPIHVEEKNGSVVITPVGKRRNLAELLKSCKRKFPKGNPHGVIDFGAAVGKEIW